LLFWLTLLLLVIVRLGRLLLLLRRLLGLLLLLLLIVLLLALAVFVELLLAFFALATLLYLSFAVVVPALRRINLLYAARTVERADPNTKNSLINWLLLRRHSDEIPESIMKAIETRAANDLARIDLSEAVDSRPMLNSLYVLAVVVVVFCAYSFFTTKALGTSLQRVLSPWKEIAPPTETKLQDIKPGNTEIPAGEKIDVAAITIGKQPEKVTAYISSDDGAYWEPNLLDPPVEQYGYWQLTLQDRHKSFDYYLTANDFRSKTFHVEVTAAPMVIDWKVTYHYPRYTGEPAHSESGGDIDALEGSVVEVEITTNVPADSGTLEVTIGKSPQNHRMARMQGSENQLLGKFALTDDGAYRVDFRDLLGRRPQIRPVKSIRVRRDLGPSLSFLEPEDLEIKRPANGSFLIRLSASDDYGVGKVMLYLRKRGERRFLLDKEYGRRGESLGVSKLFVEAIDLAKYNLHTGDVLEYWAEAIDNKLPRPNSVSTENETRLVHVTEPVNPQQRQSNSTKTASASSSTINSKSSNKPKSRLSKSKSRPSLTITSNNKVSQNSNRLPRTSSNPSPSRTDNNKTRALPRTISTTRIKIRSKS